MIKINFDDEKIIDELILVLKLFYKEEEIDSISQEINIEQTQEGNIIKTRISSTFNEKIFQNECKIADEKFPDRYKKRSAKIALYDLLQDLFPDRILPWGSLTGIRPTKLYYELIKECKGDSMSAFDMFIDTLSVPTKYDIIW